MKYKCIGSLEKEGRQLMKEGDILIIRGDEMYNITTGVDYKGLTFDDIVGNLVTITDEVPYEVYAGVDLTKEEEPTDIERFKNITDKMFEIFKKKNHDYGNSFEQSLNEEGLAALRIRGSDKWNRFKNLSKGENPLVQDESIRDTLLDLANYCIMTVIWIDKK